MDTNSPAVQLIAVTSPNSFWRDTPINRDLIKDNPSETLVFIELDLPQINWMSPQRVTLDYLIEMLERDGRLPSPHSAGVLMSFADLSVRLIPHEDITPTLLRSLVTIDDGEPVTEATTLSEP